MLSSLKLHGANLDDACSDYVRGGAKSDGNCDDSRQTDDPNDEMSDVFLHSQSKKVLAGNVS